MTLSIYILLLFVLGSVFPRSKVIGLFIIVFVWILNFNISNPDYIPLQNTYEAESYGEIGYRFLCKIFNSRGVNYFFFKIGIAAFSLLLLYRFISIYAKYPAYIAALYMIICPLDVVQNRNFFAFMILINAIPYLGRFSIQNLIKYYFFLLLACSIHASLVFFFFLPFLQKDVLSYFLKSKGTIFVLSIIMIPILYYCLSNLIDADVQSRSQAYFENPTSLVTKVGVLMLCTFNYLFVKRYQRYAYTNRTYQNKVIEKTSYIVYNPCQFVIALNMLFLLLSPMIMINITFLRLLRFVILINIIYMLNIRSYVHQGSFLSVSLYSLISLLIGLILHRDTFITDVFLPFFNENLLLR